MQQRDAEREFEEVYRDTVDRIFRYARRLYRGNEGEAEDLVQEAYLRAWRSWTDYRGESSRLTWLYRITYTEFIRRRKRMRNVDTFADLEDDALGAVDPAPGRTEWLWLSGALEQLPAAARNAVILVKCEGLTHREAAEVLGLPQGTVQSQVHNGLQRMRRLLTEGQGSPYFGMALTLPVLEGDLQRWIDCGAPSAAVERILRRLQESGPIGIDSIGRSAPGGAGSAVATGTQRLAFGRRRWLAAGAGIAVALLGGATWLDKRRRAPRGQEAVLDQVLTAVRNTKAAYASGTAVMSQSFSGEAPVEYWFKLPGRYKRKLHPTRVGRNSLPAMVIVNGGRAATVRLLPNGAPLVRSAPSAEVLRQLAVFSLFTPDGMLPELLRRRELDVTVVESELGSEPVHLIEAVGSLNGINVEWTLYVERTTLRPRRIEFTQTDPRAGWSNATYLDRFEYDGNVSDDQFVIPENS